MQVPTVQSNPALVPSYNAVKIDIHNPQVTAPSSAPTQQQGPSYNVPSAYEMPKASFYEIPQKSIYDVPANLNNPTAAQAATPSTPAPVIIPPTIAQTPAPVVAPTPAVDPTPAVAPAPVVASAPAVVSAPTAAPAQAVDVKAPVAAEPQVDVNSFIAKLSGDNFEEQANAMEAIAGLAQNAPQKAAGLLDVKVIDTLLGIMNKDSTKLTGPTPKQLEIREKIMSKKPVTEAETAEAVKISPMEQAERNKQYSIYTVAILQKLYGSEIQKMNNTTVPLTELPGAAGVVEQVKSNPNPMVRASGIDALSYIQTPEYKQDLTTLFTIAQKDKDVNVQQAATKALDKLNQLTAPVAAPVVEAPQAAPVRTDVPVAKAA